MNSLKEITVHSIKWTLIAKVLRQIIQFFVIAILSRFITPNEFGSISMILVFTGLANIINNFGLGSAIIQQKNISEIQISSIFWLNIFISISLTIVFILSASLIARFYNNDQLESLTIVISFSFILSALTSVHDSLLRKNMQFFKLFYIEISSIVISSTIAIVLAYKDYGVWALVTNNLLMMLTSVFLLWFRADWRPKFLFNFGATKQLFFYGSNLSAFNILNYVSRNVDNLLIGKFLGASALGIYGRAYQLMLLPVSHVNQVLTKVMFPALSSINEDIDRLSSIYLKSLKLISFVTFPIMIFVFINADTIIILLYGNEWKEVIPILKIFAFYGLSQSITTTTGWIFKSLGKTDILFKLGIYNTLILIISIIIGLQWGLEGIAFSFTLAAYLLLLYPNWKITCILLNKKLRSIFESLKYSILNSFILGIILYTIKDLLHTNLLLNITIILLISILTYLPLTYITQKSIFIDLTNFLKVTIKK